MKEIVTYINLAQSGDSDAYGVLVERFQNMAYAYAYAILNDFHMAQDAAQEAFIEAYRCLPTLREPLAFPAWFKRIIYKHCDRLIRGKGHAVANLEAVAEVASPLPGPAEEAERRELKVRVRNAVRELPVQQRVVTTLFYINGYSHQQIADFLEVPAGTVKSRLHASRSRLRERMIEMVQDEFKANALPESFTKETVEQAVARARELNKEREFGQAETLVRQVLEQVPQHTGALKELNHALMNGRVYRQGRWDLLPELAEYGKAIMNESDNEDVRRQFARTLLTIPAMPEAIAFLEEWIAQDGPNIERLGMLAWAKGCAGEYDAAVKLWQETMELARRSEPNEVLQHIPFIAYTLVDCFAEAGDLTRAQSIAREGWEFCQSLGASQVWEESGWFRGDGGWMVTFRTAHLDTREIGELLLRRLKDDPSPEGKANRLSIRNWMGDSETVAAEWLAWVRERVAKGEWELYKRYQVAILQGFLDGEVAARLAADIWKLLKESGTKEGERDLAYWNIRRFNIWPAIEAEDWDTAERVARQAFEELGTLDSAFELTRIAIHSGRPTPPEVMRYIEQKNVDDYYIYDWYAIAREAAAAGDEEKAFSALRKALSFWTNPPYGSSRIWEEDKYWGELRNHPEFKRAFDERRERFGALYGQMHYFPSW